jgi:hypothetical protein
MFRSITPEPIQKMNLVLGKPETYERGPSPESEETLLDGIKALDNLDSSAKNSAIRKTANICARTLFKNGPTDPSGHQTFMALPREVKNSLQRLDRLYSELPQQDTDEAKILPPKCVIDLNHITGDDSKGGMHLAFNSSHPLYDSVRNNDTGVICGKWDETQTDGTKKPKYSSCFPFNNIEETIKYALSPNTKTIAIDEKKRLIGDEHLYCIVYPRKDSLFNIKERFRSIFPLFYYGQFTGEDKDYSIASNMSPLKGTEILQKAKDIVQSSILSFDRSPNQLMFIQPESVILDIAPDFVNQTKVEQGICMEFPDNCFQDIQFPEKDRPGMNYSYLEILNIRRKK